VFPKSPLKVSGYEERGNMDGNAIANMKLKV